MVRKNGDLEQKIYGRNWLFETLNDWSCDSMVNCAQFRASVDISLLEVQEMHRHSTTHSSTFFLPMLEGGNKANINQENVEKVVHSSGSSSALVARVTQKLSIHGPSDV